MKISQINKTNCGTEMRVRGQIQELRNLTDTIYLLRLRCADFGVAKAGQFVNLSVPGFFLRRPLAIADLVECEDGKIDLTVIVARVGKGTHTLGELPVGTEIAFLGPLGNGFDLRGILTAETSRPVLIGGGSGIPPLYYLAKEISKYGVKPRIYLGFRNASAVYFLAEFTALGCEVTITTEDGSLGAAGFVTSVLPNDAKNIFACGPEGMLRSVKEWAKKLSTENLAFGKPNLQLSLEAHMGCGFGACLGCTVHTVRGLERVCVEGPVFSGDDVFLHSQEQSRERIS